MKTNSLAIAITFIVLLFSANLASGFQADINPELIRTRDKLSIEVEPTTAKPVRPSGKAFRLVLGSVWMCWKRNKF